MPVDAVVGANWGDEGKGKMTDLLAGEADFVVRFQGGRNAGHTIVNEWGRFALHMLPSGVFRNRATNVLGPGVALDIDAVLSELKELRERGVPTPDVCISNRAQVVMPYHATFDEAEEKRLGDRGFGSTKVGIAPFYADKALKLGVQVADLYDSTRLRDRLEAALAAKNTLLRHLYDLPQVCAADLVPRLLDLGEAIADRVCDTTALLADALDRGANVLLEGQLGTLRDVDHGVYPFTTSSSPLAGYGCVGAGVPPTAFRRILAVAKAYSTCVGATPFVTELFGEEADRLRENGNEFGATTGRPRRVGWFDAVATRYGCRVQGATEAALMLVDVLGPEREIPVCTAYEIDGKHTKDFPTCGTLERARPVYETWPGWGTDVSGARRMEDLPAEAVRYIDRIEALIETPIRHVSVGPERDAVISRKSQLDGR
jgi:adenylosuccinate synthase